MSRPIPVPASFSFMHPFHARPPLLLYPSLHPTILSFFNPPPPSPRQYLLHAPFTRPSPPPPLPLSTCQHHLLLQTVHPHHVSKEQHLLLYVATTAYWQ